MAAPESAELGAVPTLGVYLHIPFCAAKCDYCDFFSVQTLSPGPAGAVLARMLEDLESVLPRLGEPRIESLYVGGGTPSTLGPDCLGAFLEAVLGSVGRPVPEITVEINPRDLTAALVAALADAGVNRLSIGVQSFSETMRTTIGRRGGSLDDGRAAILSSWAGRASLDLIQCIPGQRDGTARRDILNALRLRQAVCRGIDHLSIYSLAIVEETALANRLAQLPPSADYDAEWARMTRMTDTLLREHGFRRYEVSNYAVPGRESIHNRGYWAQKPYLGIGPGAVSTLAAAGGGPIRLSIPPSIGRYTSEGWESRSVEPLTARDLLLERFMLGLRTRWGVDLTRLAAELGIGDRFLTRPRVRRRLEAGELAVVDGRLAATADGLLVLDAVLVDIAVALDDEQPRLRVPWTEWRGATNLDSGLMAW